MSRRLLPAVLLLLFGVSALAADRPQVELMRAPVPEDAPAEIHLGQPVILQVTVSLPAGYEGTAPVPVAEQEELALRPGTAPQGSARPGGGMTQIHSFHLIPLQLGEISFAGFKVPWRLEGGETGAAVSEALTLTVLATIEDPVSAAAADIRGPATLPVPPSWPWWVALALFLAGAAALWFWWRRRGPGPGTEAEMEVVDPFAGLEPAAWALAALKRLEQDDVLAHRGTAAYHVRLAEIIRRYLGGRFHIPTLERTTHELVQDARLRLGQLAGAQASLRALLMSCDMVKFARLEPLPQTSRELLDRARLFVEETRPRPPVENVVAGK